MRNTYERRNAPGRQFAAGTKPEAAPRRETMHFRQRKNKGRTVACPEAPSGPNSPHRPLLKGFAIRSDSAHTPSITGRQLSQASVAESGRISFSLGTDGLRLLYGVWACGVPMTDRAEDFRQEAARYLALAKITVDLKARKELVIMAARLHNWANSVPADFDLVLQALNDQQTASSAAPQPVAQQQQQIQPKKEE
jgi:hypothetical protein